jgi:hypothetical protein
MQLHLLALELLYAFKGSGRQHRVELLKEDDAAVGSSGLPGGSLDCRAKEICCLSLSARTHIIGNGHRSQGSSWMAAASSPAATGEVTSSPRGGIRMHRVSSRAACWTVIRRSRPVLSPSSAKTSKIRITGRRTDHIGDTVM